MQQHELRPPRGAKRPRKRIGRGNASGHGTYSGKGLNGQQSRSGYRVRSGFEGGQTPLIRRLPRRRGFRNPFRVEYTPVNLKDLAKFPAGTEITPESLQEAGIVRTARRPVKILADGDVSGALTVRAHRVSAAARDKIEGAGGSVEELTPRPDPENKRDRRSKAKKKADASEAKEQAPAKAEREETDDDGDDSETSESTTAE